MLFGGYKRKNPNSDEDFLAYKGGIVVWKFYCTNDNLRFCSLLHKENFSHILRFSLSLPFQLFPSIYCIRENPLYLPHPSEWHCHHRDRVQARRSWGTKWNLCIAVSPWGQAALSGPQRPIPELIKKKNPCVDYSLDRGFQICEKNGKHILPP